jgi:mutator protein MutT
MELWEAYQFCPRCGGKCDREATSPFQCQECGFIRFFNPACAVAAIVLDPEGRALFIRRAREPAIGKLGMPGGFVDCGETAEEAIKREVREEVGVELDGLQYFGSWPNRYPTPNAIINVCDLFFIGRARETETTLASDEVASVLWVHPRQVSLDDIAFPSMRAALEAFERRNCGNSTRQIKV